MTNHFGSFITQTQADQDVQADIAYGEREYRRIMLEDRPRPWETDEPDTFDLDSNS